MKFIDREKALRILRSYWEGEGRLLVVYGRRRVGKSRLIREFLDTLHDGDYVYFLASRRPIRYNLRKFSVLLSSKLGFKLPSFDSFVDVFKFLSQYFLQKKFLVVIDEFTYLVERDEGILSDFQEIIDNMPSNSGLKIILSGSLVGMMETRVLGYRSPLYGRTRRTIKLLPLKFRYLPEWYGHNNYEELFRLYSVTNGVPRYLEFFSGKNVVSEIKENFFDESSFLFRDARELLREELRDPTNYMMILEAIANGMTKLSEISNYTYLEPTKITPYIDTLRNMGIVRREIPILAPKKSRRGIYIISDFYFLFWFRFVSPYYEEIENQDPKNAINDFEKNFETYIGTPFEIYVRRVLRDILANMGHQITKLGKWWHKDIDIDIVGIDDRAKEVIFGEVKWGELTQKDVYRIAAKLEEKSKRFPYKKTYTKKYCIVAREFQETPKDKDIITIDMKKIVTSTTKRNQQDIVK